MFLRASTVLNVRSTKLHSQTRPRNAPQSHLQPLRALVMRSQAPERHRVPAAVLAPAAKSARHTATYLLPLPYDA